MTVSPYDSRDPVRPCQGSMYRKVIYRASVPTSTLDSEPLVCEKMSEWFLPYAIVLTQECDLEQDHENREKLDGSGSDTNHDKLLPSVLMCPGYLSVQFREGKHLDFLNRRMMRYPSDPWRSIKANQNPRYHYLCAWTLLQVPELILDFKHFFTLPTDVLRNVYGSEQHYIARLSPLYREDLNQRFAAYLARVGLPIPLHQFPADS